MKELRVKVSLVMEHAPDRVEQPTHDGDDRDLLLLAAGEETFVSGLDLRAALDGDQRGHEQGQAQVTIAGAADVPRRVLHSALARTRIEPGVSDPLFGFEVLGQDEQFAEQPQGADFPNARHAAEPLDLDGEIGLPCGQFGGGLLEGFDPFLEMANVGGQIGGDQSIAVRGKRDGVEPGLFASQLAAELDQAPAELLQGQDRVGGRRPGHELHALEELEDAQGINAIGLGSGQPGALEVFDRPRIDDHHFDAPGPLQGQSQAQAVNAGGFQTDTGAGSAAGEQLEQLPVTGRRIGQGAGTFGLAVAEEGHDQFTGADIDAGAHGRDYFGLFHPVVLVLVWSLRIPELLRMSSTDLVNAGSPPQQRGGGLRYSAAWTKESGDRSNEQGRGGALTPPCPQASAASRRCFTFPTFPSLPNPGLMHGCEILGVATRHM